MIDASKGLERGLVRETSVFKQGSPRAVSKSKGVSVKTGKVQTTERRYLFKFGELAAFGMGKVLMGL